MDGGAWWVAVYGVVKSWTRLSDFTFTFYFHALEKEMATHSSVLAWRIPGTGEPGGLPSMGSHRVRDMTEATQQQQHSILRFYNPSIVFPPGIIKNRSTMWLIFTNQTGILLTISSGLKIMLHSISFKTSFYFKAWHLRFLALLPLPSIIIVSPFMVNLKLERNLLSCIALRISEKSTSLLGPSGSICISSW